MWHLLHEERFRYVYRSLRSCSILALIAHKKRNFNLVTITFLLWTTTVRKEVIFLKFCVHWTADSDASWTYQILLEDAGFLKKI